MKPNIGNPSRILYAIIGLALVVSPLVGGLKLWMQITLPVLGLLSLITAATGW